MGIIVLHAGQTGVERGAARAAHMLGIAIEGVCAIGTRDEFGVLPAEVADGLSPCERRGARSAVRDTLKLADALVICVPDPDQASLFTGVDVLLRTARARMLPTIVIGPLSDLEAAARSLGAQLGPTMQPSRILVTGPRLTRWRDGERYGARIVGALAALEPAMTGTPAAHGRKTEEH